MTLLEWALLALLSLLWGSSFVYNKIVLAHWEPFTIVLGRAGLAAIVLVIALRLAGHRMPLTLAAWREFAILSLFNNILPFVLILWGQKQITAGLTAILNATTPLFAALMAHAIAQERLTALRLIGVVIGMAGVTVMMGPDVVRRGLGGDVLAQIAVLAASASYAFAALYGRRVVAMGIQPQMAAAGQLSVTGAVALMVVLFVDQPWTLPMPGLEVWAAILGLALLSTALGYAIYYRLLAGAGGVNASLVTLLVPVSAFALGVLLLGEGLSLRQAAGMGVILAGLAVADGRIVAFLRRSPRR